MAHPHRRLLSHLDHRRHHENRGCHPHRPPQGGLQTMTGAVDGAVMRPASSPVLPALIAGAGDRPSLRFLEYFTVNIRNKNTRAAYGRTAGDFLNSLRVPPGDAGDFAFS